MHLVILAKFLESTDGNNGPEIICLKRWITQVGVEQAAIGKDKQGNLRYLVQKNNWELCGQERMDAGLNGYIPNGEDRDTASPSFSLGNLCTVKTTKYNADRVIYSRGKRARNKEEQD